MTQIATPMTEQTFILPDLGEGLAEADILRWLVAEGDLVAVDQAVAEVETAKAAVEVPTPFGGRVVKLHADEGTTLQVGKPLITVATSDEVASTASDADHLPDTSSKSAEAETYRHEERAGSGNVLIGYGTTASVGSGRRRRPRNVDRGAHLPRPADEPPAVQASAAGARPPRVISPLVRRLAKDNGIDLHAIVPSDPGGVIRKADVQRAIAAASDTEADSPPAEATAPASGTEAHAPGERRIALSGFRKAVSAALTRSRSEIPEATVWVDVDATALWGLRESTRTSSDPGPGLLAYIARFVVVGLKEYPVLNARLDMERQEIVEFNQINLGIAVQSDRGLMVPPVIGADSLTTSQLDHRIREVTTAAREGRATADELAAGTFTLNNFGSLRVDGSAMIINHPQVAILGVGRIIDRPWAVDGKLCLRKMTQLSFVFDHRVCDGGTAAGFLRTVADAIENPMSSIARL